MISGVIIEGGDQIASILTLLLIPICLTDNRINHWYLPKKTKSNSYLKLISYSSFFVISLQIAVIYFHAFTAKLFVPEWLNGTATYYWFTHQIFGVPEYLRVTIAHLLSIPFVGICITWGGIFIELILFAWLFYLNLY